MFSFISCKTDENNVSKENSEKLKKLVITAIIKEVIFERILYSV